MRGERILGIILATVVVLTALSSLNLINFVSFSNPYASMALSHALTLRPNGPGTVAEWTGNVNTTNWQHVSERAYLTNTADYVYTSTDGKRDSYNLENHGTETWRISNVRVVIYARLASSADDQITLQLVIGTTPYDGQTYNLGPNWGENGIQCYTSDWPLNPSTTGAWTWAQIDALQAGFKSVKVGGSMTEERVAQLYVQVIRADWNPSISCENAPKEFTINVNITSDTTGVASWGFKLEYDSSLLYTNNTMVQEGPFLKYWIDPELRYIKTTFPYEVKLTHVAVTGYWAEWDPEWPPGLTGSGTIASITFKVVGTGNCTLHLFEAKLVDNDVNEIPLDEVGDGIFYTNYPKADFTFTPDHPAKNQLINFNASTSYDPDGTIASYEWNFGDGVVITKVLPSAYHKYSSFGTYKVVLTVTDNSGKKDSKDRDVTVGWTPSPRYSYIPVNPRGNETVAFNASTSYDPDGTIVAYKWDFNDTTPIITKSHPYINHVFTNVGIIYNVTLTVVDNDGFSMDWGVPEGIYVGPGFKVPSDPIYPYAQFTFNHPHPAKNQLIKFDASTSYKAGGTIVSYVWDFGDGNVTTPQGDPIEYHKYTNYGTYMVNLTVTDNSARKDWGNWTAKVGWYPEPTFFYHPKTLPPEFPPRSPYVVTTEVVFNATGSYDPDGSILSYEWHFNDTTANATGVSTTHKFFAYKKVLNVTLTVTDNEGFKATFEVMVVVRWPGDANGDNFVNAIDFGILGSSWFQGPGGPRWDERVDFSLDNFVNAVDFGILGFYWFKKAPWG